MLAIVHDTHSPYNGRTVVIMETFIRWHIRFCRVAIDNITIAVPEAQLEVLPTL